MHVRCPHCHNAMEIVEEHELTDIACPSCGSTFNLFPETESCTTTPTWLDHFQLLNKLGAGGFGTVWKARDAELDRLVAVRIPRRYQDRRLNDLMTTTPQASDDQPDASECCCGGATNAAYFMEERKWTTPGLVPI